MDKERAKEITASPDMVHVVYNGMPIYIENVNDDGMACIHYLDHPTNKQEVRVTNLIEQRT